MNANAGGLLSSTAITVVHKYIRHELFAVSQLISSAGPDRVKNVQQALRDVTVLLYGHAEHEDSHFAALLADASPELAKRMHDDHQRLDALLDDVLTLAEDLESAKGRLRVSGLLQLHLDWNRFVSAYLAHLDDEERIFFPAIQEHLPPIAVVAEAAGNQDVKNRQEFMLKLKLALTPDEYGIIAEKVLALAEA